MPDPYAPKKSDKFTFGLWTVGNPGRDPFGEAVREPMAPTYIVKMLSQLGAYGVNLHDNDLVPYGASAAERDRIVREFKSALSDHGLQVPMATTNLFTHPVFKDGAFTANDPKVRAFAVQKTMRSIDLGMELGAKIYVMWGGREGVEADACRDAREALKRYRDCVNFLCDYVRDQKYDVRFALEAKPNEPRSDLYLPTTGHMLAFIETLDHPEMVGVNPEVAHEQMSGLNFHHGIAQAIDAGKLFHIDLNDQKPGRYDQDLRFGSESLKVLSWMARLAPSLPFAHYILGKLRVDTGDAAAAIPELEIARKSFPDEAGIYFALGKAYAQVGRKADAAKARTQFARLNALAAKQQGPTIYGGETKTLDKEKLQE